MVFGSEKERSQLSLRSFPKEASVKNFLRLLKSPKENLKRVWRVTLKKSLKDLNESKGHDVALWSTVFLRSLSTDSLQTRHRVHYKVHRVCWRISRAKRIFSFRISKWSERLFAEGQALLSTQWLVSDYKTSQREQIRTRVRIFKILDSFCGLNLPDQAKIPKPFH